MNKKYIKYNFLFLGLLSGGISTVAAQSHLEFDQHEISLGDEKPQMVLAGDLVGDAHSEFVSITKDSIGDIALSIYAFENNEWQKVMSADLPDDILFVDIARLDNRNRFIFYQKNRFSWFNPENKSIQSLFSADFDFKPGHGKWIPWVNLSVDLNGDHLDEFILPSQSGFSILIQQEEGTFSDPINIGPPEPYLDFPGLSGDKRTYGDTGISPITIPRYLSRVHLFDQNLDGRKDLVFRNGNRFDVYLQLTDGQFSSEPTPFHIVVPVGTDAPYSLGFQMHGKVGFGAVVGLRSSMTYQFMERFTDVNGDGISDIIVHTLTGRSVFKLKSEYTIYFGSASESGVQFTTQNKTILSPSGTSGVGEIDGYTSKWFHDFNQDDNIDLFRYDVRFGLGSILRTLITKTVYIDYEYFQNNGETFSHKPSVRNLIKTKFDWDTGFFPAIKIGDVTGDGNTDLVITMSPEKLHVYPWLQETSNLSTTPQVVYAPIPGSERSTWLLDLNDDKQKEIVMFHLSKTDNFRLVVLTVQ